MKEIDRRTLLGAAGASIVAASCSSSDSNNNIVEIVEENTTGRSGTCENHGHALNQTRPGIPATFSPQYLCAVYIKYGADGRPAVRHAYAALEGTGEADIARLAGSVLEALRTNTYGANIRRVAYNFQNFCFKSQQYIVLFVDNDPNFVKFNPDPQNTRKNIVRFSPFSGYYPYEDRNENYSFYNLRKLPVTQGSFETDQAYCLEYWNIDDEGHPLRPIHLFSMNIHLLMAAQALPNPLPSPQPTPLPSPQYAWIPIILDPDTGNMGIEP